MIYIKSIFFSLLFFFYVASFAQKDPTWDEMIHRSDAIALVQFNTTGQEQVEAIIKKTYKGELIKKQKIIITNFSNSKNDFIYAKQKSLVFLKNSLTKDSNGVEIFKVWTPTAGEYPVKGSICKYDLLFTTYHKIALERPLSKMVSLINNTLEPDTNYHKSLINTIIISPLSEENSQYLMSLYYSKYSLYNPIFETLSKQEDSDVLYALTKLLGQIPDEKSENLLIELANHHDETIYREALSVLSKNANFSKCSALISKFNSLNKVKKLSIYPFFVQMKCSEIADSLSVFLQTENEQQYNEITNAILKLEMPTALCTAIQNELNNYNFNRIPKALELIKKYELNCCKKALIDFVLTVDKFKYTEMHNSMEVLSMFLKEDTIISDSLIKQFQLIAYDTVQSLPWIKSFAISFESMQSDTLKQVIKAYFLDISGLNTASVLDSITISKWKLNHFLLDSIFKSDTILSKFELVHKRAYFTTLKKKSVIQNDLIINDIKLENSDFLKNYLIKKHNVNVQNIYIFNETNLPYWNVYRDANIQKLAEPYLKPIKP